MNEKLVVLAMIRAAMTNDTDTLEHLMGSEHDPDALLISLLGITVALLEEGCTEPGPLAVVDGWLDAIGGATRARGPR